MSTLWIKNEDCSIDRLCGQVTFKCLVNGYAIHIRVVDKPNYLIAKQLRVVLRIQIRLSRFGTVQLETFSNSFS